MGWPRASRATLTARRKSLLIRHGFGSRSISVRDPSPLSCSMLVIDETWNHRDAEVAIGDTLKLELSENATTGYRWRIVDVDPALRILDDSYEGPGPAPGGGGLRRW